MSQVSRPSMAIVPAAAARIEREIHPGAFSREQVNKPRCADAGRLHPLEFRRAGELGTDRLANDRFAAVAADKIGAGDRQLARRCRDRGQRQ